MTITIVGTGYVGLVTGISLSKLGHKVYCVDSNAEKISTIKKGKATFYEPGVDQLLKKVLKTGKFYPTENLEESISKSNITIIAVGTPTINNKIDLSAIKQASVQIGKALQKNKWLVVLMLRIFSSHHQ